MEEMSSFKAKGRFMGEMSKKRSLIRCFYLNHNPKNVIRIDGDYFEVEVFFEKMPNGSLLNALDDCFVEEFISGNYEVDEKELVQCMVDAILPEDENCSEEFEEEGIYLDEKDLLKHPEIEETECNAEEPSFLVESGNEEADSTAEEAEGSDEEVDLAVEEAEGSDEEVDLAVEDAEDNEEKDSSTVETAAETVEAPTESEDKKDFVSTVNISPDLETKRYPRIQVLDDLAKQSGSFEGLVENLSDYLELEERKDLFKDIVYNAVDLQKITWDNIAQKIEIKPYDKVIIRSKVTGKLGRISAMTLIKTLLEYQDFDFVSQNTSEVSAEKNWLEEIFGKQLETIDKTKPIEEQAIDVLKLMGWKEDMEEFSFVVKTAMKLEKIDDDNMHTTLYEMEKVSKEDWYELRTILSDFVNDFLASINYPTKFNALNFLRNLKEILK